MIENLNILITEVYKILLLLIPILTAVAMIVWLDRRVWAFVQKRKGPNVVGPFGLFQSLADALKYIFKEIIIPASANKIIFILFALVKAIVPRYRYDQLMKLGWKIFLPFSLIWVVITASYLFYFNLLPTI